MATTEAPGNMQRLLMDAAVDLSLDMTAQMCGIPRELVTQIVQTGLPMMARMAQKNPDLFSKMYAQSVEMLPEPMRTFYDKLSESPAAQARLVEEYTSLYGPMVETVNREAASQAGTTEAQAGQVMATTMPALSQAMARATEGDGEAGMMSWLKGIGKQ